MLIPSRRFSFSLRFQKVQPCTFWSITPLLFSKYSTFYTFCYCLAMKEHNVAFSWPSGQLLGLAASLCEENLDSFTWQFSDKAADLRVPIIIHIKMYLSGCSLIMCSHEGFVCIQIHIDLCKIFQNLSCISEIISIIWSVKLRAHVLFVKKEHRNGIYDVYIVM